MPILGALPNDRGLYPDVEHLVAESLRSALALPEGHADSRTPDDLEDWLPFIQAVRYGGADDGVTDGAALDVDYYAATRSEALLLARLGHQLLTSGRLTLGSALVDVTEAVVGVVERPRDGGLRRFGGSYTVSVRRVRT